MNCPRCHHEIIGEEQYCPNCGYKLVRCSNCQQPLMENAKFCSHCGQALNSVQKESQIGGFYVPINDEEYIIEEKEHIDFKEVEVSKKVNKPVIVVSVIVMVLLTVVSLWYINKVQPKTIVDDNTNLIEPETMKIGGQTHESSLVANINQEGNTFVYKDKVYMCDDSGYIVSMNLDLTEQKIILKEKASNLYIQNDIIYYLDQNQFLCSMKLDGSDKKIIYNQAVYYMHIKEDKVYFQLDSEQEKIYVYDLKTNQVTKINDRRSYNLNVVGDMIYYTSTDGIYCIGIDGKGDKKLVSENCYSLIYFNQKLYYSTSQNQIQCYDTKTQSIEVVVEETSQLCNITETDIFYKTTSGLKGYNFDTKQSYHIYNGNVSTCEVVGDKLVVLSDSYNQKYKIIMDKEGDQQQRLFVGQDGTIV